MSLNGKVRPDCYYASNPYHECTDTCLKRIAEGGGRTDRKKKGSLLNIKLGRKKMTESRTMPPPREIVNTPTRDRVYNSSATMPPARFPPSDKIEQQNGKHYSSDLQSGEIHEEDPPFIDKLAHFPYLAPASGILTTADPHNPYKDPPREAVKSNDSEPPLHQKGNENHNELSGAGPHPINGEARKGTTGSAPGALSFTFSGIVDSDDDEVQSVTSDASVSVGKYRVKGRLSAIMHSIFDKYGDVAAGCQLESIAMRSYYLECVCFVVQELQTTQTAQLSKNKLKEMLAIVKDAESIGMDVGWLRRVLSENAETLELISQHQAMEEAKTNCEDDIKSMRKKLESQMEGLALKEEEIADAQREIAETKAHLRELELKSSVLTDTVSSVKSKVEALNGKSMLDGVL
ncbi:uncharacterized protein LOC21391736 isoform X2 [Morus notabilis]|uniref:uncharacterized protein LOC21391736 isoform X2 n=1 Tax=Morus notabilis TaxID=981085 RepID=UPI000CED62B6|nr:uncharacterized protein LOC21391736 isoform X2 [Morus notabilis]